MVRPEVWEVISNGNIMDITLNYHKLNELNVKIITDLCEIWRISIGSIEGDVTENKITAMSHFVGE